MRPRPFLFATALAVYLMAAAATAAAQNPFVGTWKLNQEKSQMAGDITEVRSGGRRMRSSLLPEG